MIERATAEQLTGLAEHLDISPPPDAVRDGDFTSWEPGRFRLFITHVATHKDLAQEIKAHIQPYHVSAFVAHSDIEPTQEWLEQILGALQTADALLALLTPDFHQSLWTDQEVGVAIGRSILVIPLRLGEDPYGLFGKIQALSGNEKTPETIAKEIVETLIRKKNTTRRITYSLVSALAKSDSYPRTFTLMDLIESSDYLDATLATSMRQSVKSNSSVAKAYRVPERVEALISTRIKR